MSVEVTVAIPVRDGRPLLDGVLAALARQTRDHELLICDSGSTDGSVDLARSYGARVIEIAPVEFGHGRTRNLLMTEARGEHVALLTQDAEPADPGWLESLLSGFSLAEDVALVYGPYLARADAATAERLALERWFASLSPEGTPVVDRLAPDELGMARELLLSRRGFFTDANACIARAAWRQVPFRDIGYAEDRALALDMLLAGRAKCFLPGAAVLHSHSYTPAQQLRRSFDEGRALYEVYGWREPVGPRHLCGQLRGALSGLNHELESEGVGGARRIGRLAVAGASAAARVTGAMVGSRADLLPGRVQRSLSLERRPGAPSPGDGPPSAQETSQP